MIRYNTDCPYCHDIFDQYCNLFKGYKNCDKSDCEVLKILKENEQLKDCRKCKHRSTGNRGVCVSDCTCENHDKYEDVDKEGKIMIEELKAEFAKYLYDSIDYYSKEPLTERKLLQIWLDCAEPREKKIIELTKENKLLKQQIEKLEQQYDTCPYRYNDMGCYYCDYKDRELAQ